MEEKKPRKDKQFNRAKVIAALVNNPLATEREVSKETGISVWSAHNHVSELEQNWAISKVIDLIIDSDTKITQKWQSILLNRMDKEPEKIATRDILTAIDQWAKRRALFKWNATDDEWWLKSFTDFLNDIIK